MYLDWDKKATKSEIVLTIIGGIAWQLYIIASLINFLKG